MSSVLSPILIRAKLFQGLSGGGPDGAFLIVKDGLKWLDWPFVTSFAKRGCGGKTNIPENVSKLGDERVNAGSANAAKRASRRKLRVSVLRRFQSVKKRLDRPLVANFTKRDSNGFANTLVFAFQRGSKRVEHTAPKTAQCMCRRHSDRTLVVV
jgi:hypothetical protein